MLSAIREKIEKIINEEIRPAVQMDGGDIALLEVEKISQNADDLRVKISFHGACVGCALSAITLHMGIEARLKEAIPEIKEVVAIE